MPTPVSPVLITIKVTNGNAGEYVKVTNLTSGNTMRGILNSSGEAILNTADKKYGYTWNNGDAIQVEIHGRINQVVNQTLSSVTTTRKFTLSNSADTATVGVNM